MAISDHVTLQILTRTQYQQIYGDTCRDTADQIFDCVKDGYSALMKKAGRFKDSNPLWELEESYYQSSSASFEDTWYLLEPLFSDAVPQLKGIASSYYALSCCNCMPFYISPNTLVILMLGPQ